MTVRKKQPRRRQVGGTHYRNKNIQPVDAMQDWMTHEEYRGYLWGSVIKYLGRWKDKGGIQDLKKAQHFLEFFIKHEGKKYGKRSSV